jgi:hypothetical protein
MARMRKKAELPRKSCAVCGRPFTWRRKWARDWDAVRYCSDACRRRRAPSRTPGAAPRSGEDDGTLTRRPG